MTIAELRHDVDFCVTVTVELFTCGWYSLQPTCSRAISDSLVTTKMSQVSRSLSTLKKKNQPKKTSVSKQPAISQTWPSGGVNQEKKVFLYKWFCLCTVSCFVCCKFSLKPPPKVQVSMTQPIRKITGDRNPYHFHYSLSITYHEEPFCSSDNASCGVYKCTYICSGR